MKRRKPEIGDISEETAFMYDNIYIDVGDIGPISIGIYKTDCPANDRKRKMAADLAKFIKAHHQEWI